MAPDLLKIWPEAEVVACAADRRHSFQTLSVADGDCITLLHHTIQVLGVAAHTAHHIAFWLPGEEDEQLGSVLFCGDTLFSGGCGRLFEGTAVEMHHALQKLTLPDDTRCAALTNTPRPICAGPWRCIRRTRLFSNAPGR